MPHSLLVTFPLDTAAHTILAPIMAGVGEVVCLDDFSPADRPAAIRQTNAILTWNLKVFSPDELGLLGHARLLQFMTAGVDFVPLSTLPPALPVAANGGAYAEAMAEHALAMAMAAAKRIVRSHGEVARGEFHQHRPNRMLAGSICAILGFGGVGVATALLLHAIGLRIHAINRSPRAHAALDWFGAPDQLDTMLAAADILVIAAPLTKATLGLIGARELSLMKPNATVINLARGEIIDEAALFAHLQTHPDFTACIDAWWVEPVRHGSFRMDHPFTDLANVIASPHNSASVMESRGLALQRAAANCRRALLGETPLHLVRPEDRML
ncbi:MAG: hydroxyacid dehydrogenase [Acetobacteraceae bacterium]|nr:hydroxyacid dehydrogenase [Acetobacteraceae bacterium]MSP30798.1 hydroxyacid dehydrogenase [Acetobacteraceae bacterium]